MHTHTCFCDGKDDTLTMCEAAYKKKLRAIGFSAHAPIEKKTGIKTDWHLREDRLYEYIDQVLAAKKKWRGKLEVFLGFEVDYIKGLRSPADSDIKALNPDYLIGSAHYIIPPNGARPFTVDGGAEEFEDGLREGFGGDAPSLMLHYYDMMAEMIAIGGFDILGHADLIKKNCLTKNYWPPEYESIRQKEIAQAAAKAGLTVEVNTGGINRGKINEVYPSVSFLQFFRKCNVPAIITSDAHRAGDIDGNYDAAVRALLSSGFDEHVIYFEKTKNPLTKNKKVYKLE